jgi:type IV pilus assembly protein PilC
MPKFNYIAVGPDGAQIKGCEEAPTFAALGQLLHGRDLTIKEAREKKSIMQFEITRKKVPRKDLMHFSRQLSAFLKASVPILDALETMQEEMSNKLFRAALEDIVDNIKAGASFSAAAKAHPEAFPPVYLGMLESAELTGNLDKVLDQLSEYLERELEARRKVISALTYPAIVGFMSVATVFVLAIFVLPKFRDFFASLDATLPLPTRILLGASGFISDQWWMFPIIAASVAGFAFWTVRSEKGRAFRDQRILSLPVIGDLATHIILERFCRVLASMAGAGVPIPEALAVTTDGTNNVVWKTKLSAAREALMRGEGLAQPMTETGLFPAAARQMFRVGEETGTLDQQLDTAANYFEKELDYKITRFTNMFEPAVIIFMGLVVGFVAIALVTAMYGIFNQVDI